MCYQPAMFQFSMLSQSNFTAGVENSPLQGYPGSRIPSAYMVKCHCKLYERCRETVCSIEIFMVLLIFYMGVS